jgi:LmbE family N-acetylglucosaminyl deacetylase/tetratricopeptide (TPR) repeat protein
MVILRHSIHKVSRRLLPRPGYAAVALFLLLGMQERLQGTPTRGVLRPTGTIVAGDARVTAAPLDSIPALRRIGDAMIRSQNLGEALPIYRRIAMAVPHDLGASITLADLYAWTGDYDHAVALYRDVVAVDPVNLAGLKGLARVMRWATRYSEAEVQYAAVLHVEPDDIDALIGMAITEAQERNFESALAYIDRAKAKSPSNIEVIRTRGDILAWSNHFSEAEEAYVEALALDPSSGEVYRSLGDLYRWAGRYASASDAFMKARALDPRNPGILVSLANVSIDAGLTRQAEQALKDLFAVDPNNAYGYDILRRLESRNRIDYAAIIDGYAKPVVLLLSNLIIGYYFWRRKERLAKRSPYLARFMYILWPALAGLWGVLFLVSRATGLWGTNIITGAAEFGTVLVWMVAFIALVWYTRGEQQANGKSILAIGAHPDDIELGCGGTLSRYKDMGYAVYGLVVTSGEAGNPHTNEKVDRRAEAEKGASVLGLDGIWIYRFKDTVLYSQMNEIKDVIEEKIRETKADIIITQSPHDIHQDHKAVFEATKIAARGNKTLLCYEDVSTEAHFAANYFVDITDFMEDKIRAVQAHRTQNEKPYMHPEKINGRAAHRGLQTGVKYAEAFLLYKGMDLWPSS